MKSERAKRRIDDDSDCSCNFERARWVVPVVEARDAVELAESDARERAIKSLCHAACYGTCISGVTPDGCGKMNAFLGHYDKL